jgi:glycosyltransferase involved in cell wall biosynthesis
MKILFLFPHFIQPGGAANVVIKFAKELQLKKHSVKIICAKASKQFLEENRDLNIQQLKIPPSNTFLYWALFPFWQIKINKELSSYSDYILFSHVLPSNWWTWIYRKKNKKVKIVWYCNEPSAFIHSNAWIKAIKNPFMRMGARILNPILKRIDTYLENSNDIVICNSNFTASEYKNIYNKKSDCVIYPPIEKKSIKINTEKDNFIFTISRLTKFKNIDKIIDVFGKISKKHSAYKLIVAGDGEDKENLENLVKKKGLNKKIIFLGRISDKKLTELYKKSKMTIVSAKKEPFGLVPVESMQHGTPVVAHNSGGPKETVLHNKTGFLFNNKKELEKLINKLIEINKKDYTKIQKKCIEEARKYEISNSIQKLENILKK